MAEYQKFIFSENYSREPENLERIQQKKILDARAMMSNEIEEAKTKAYEDGFQAGQEMALKKLKTEMELHLNTIVENITKINNFKPELKEIFENHSTACIRHITKNMFFNSEELFSKELLEQALDNALNNLPIVSQIVIKIPSSCKIYLEDTKLEDKIKQKGITDFRFEEDDSLHSGECRIQWDKSGLLSSKKESFEKINSAFNAFLSNEDLELSDNTNTVKEEPKKTTETDKQDETTTNNIIEESVMKDETLVDTAAPENIETTTKN